MTRTAIALTTLLTLWTPSLRAQEAKAEGKVQTQDTDREKIKQEILKKVEEKLKEEEERILKDVEKIIDEELAKKSGAGTPPAADAPKWGGKEGDKPAPKKSRGYLGVNIEALDDDEREELKLADDEGVRLSSVADGSPAEKAGLQAGDIVISVDGAKVNEKTLPAIIQSKSAGAEVEIGYVRKKEKQALKVKLGTFPQDE